MSMSVHVPPAIRISQRVWHPATHQIVACVTASMVIAFAVGAAFGMRGPFLGTLGANGLEVSVTAGIATWLGMATWVVARRVLAHGKGYPVIATTGCVLTLVALALVGNTLSWTAAAALLVAAGVGIGLWESSLDYLLSATNRRSTAPVALLWQRALAQTTFAWGALVMTGNLLSGGTLGGGFTYLWLLLPVAGLATMVAAVGKRAVSAEEPLSVNPAGEYPRIRLRLVGIAILTMGLANFALLAYQRDVGDPRLHAWLPAMGAMGIMIAVISARLLRRVLPVTGRRTDTAIGLCTLLYAPCAFFGDAALFATGMVLWGAGLGALHAWASSTLADGLPNLTVVSRRGVAHLLLASAGFLGSVLLGAASLKGTGIAAATAITLQSIGLACLIFSRPRSLAKEMHA